MARARSSEIRILPRGTVEVRNSRIHGRGVFARRRVPAGSTVLEYAGEKITQEEGWERYDDTKSGSITLLFTVDDRYVIDGGVGGNEARYINHSCEPNCESYVKRGRVFIRALRDIAAGDELTYTYDLLVGGPVVKVWARRYRCRCGALTCRRTMLEPALARRLRALLARPPVRRRTARSTTRARGGQVRAAS